MMTKILTQDSSGVISEVEHTSAIVVLSCASNGELIEVAATGTVSALMLTADGELCEVSITFGETGTIFVPTPTWTF